MKLRATSLRRSRLVSGGKLHKRYTVWKKSERAHNQEAAPKPRKKIQLKTTCKEKVSLRELHALEKDVNKPKVKLVEAPREALQILQSFLTNSMKTRMTFGKTFKIGAAKILMTETGSHNTSILLLQATRIILATFSSNMILKHNRKSKREVISLLSSNSLNQKRKKYLQMNCSNSKSSFLKTTMVRNRCDDFRNTTIAANERDRNLMIKIA